MADANSRMNVPLDRRCRMAMEAGWEIEELQARLRAILGEFDQSTQRQSARIGVTLLDRVQALADVLMSIGEVDDDAEQSDEDLSATLRIPAAGAAN